MPKPESVKCEHVELIVSGGRAEDAAEDMCLVGEAKIGSGELSIVMSGSPVFTVLFMRVRSHGCMQSQDGVRNASAWHMPGWWPVETSDRDRHGCEYA